jgi:exopolyphosphatase / guanosine-5'-triphosphate,3'-diphosphate pyrophosphatase
MRIAIVDCGSNTFNLLVADADREGWKQVFRSKLPVKLGSGGYDAGRIMESRFIRGIDALLTYRHAMDNYGVQKVYAFATSAIRDAANGPEFVRRADQVAGIAIQLIDGDREAELIFSGVRQAVELDDDYALVMDIGGGSTEFIIGNRNGIAWKRSYRLGVSRIYDQLKPEERLTHENVRALRGILDGELGDLREALDKYPCKSLIGSSGSFDTLLDLFRHAAQDVNLDVPPGISNDIPLSAFPAIHAWLMGSTYDERLRHPAIPQIRAELMPVSSYMIKHVLEMHPFRRLWHCSYALKEGAMQELWASEPWPALETEGETPEDFLEA